MGKVIAALVALAFVALFIIANSGDPGGAPAITGSHGESASVIRPATPTPPAQPAAADAGATAATVPAAAAPAEPVAAAPIKMSARRTTVVHASAP